MRRTSRVNAGADKTWAIARLCAYGWPVQASHPATIKLTHCLEGARRGALDGHPVSRPAYHRPGDCPAQAATRSPDARSYDLLHDITAGAAGSTLDHCIKQFPRQRERAFRRGNRVVASDLPRKQKSLEPAATSHLCHERGSTPRIGFHRSDQGDIAGMSTPVCRSPQQLRGCTQRLYLRPD
jgi:hypothetical protein